MLGLRGDGCVRCSSRAPLILFVPRLDGFFDFDFENTGSELNVNVPGAPFEAHAKLKVDNKWSIGGRLGYLASPGTLLYVSGGFTQVTMSNLNLSAGGPFPNVATAISVPNFAASLERGRKQN